MILIKMSYQFEPDRKRSRPDGHYVWVANDPIKIYRYLDKGYVLNQPYFIYLNQYHG